MVKTTGVSDTKEKYIAQLRTSVTKQEKLPGYFTTTWNYLGVQASKVSCVFSPEFDQTVVDLFKKKFDEGKLEGSAFVALTEKHVRMIDLVGLRRNKETLDNAKKVYDEALMLTEIGGKQELIWRKVKVVLERLRALRENAKDSQELASIDEEEDVETEAAAATTEERVVYDEEKEAIVNGDEDYTPASESRARNASHSRAPSKSRAPKAPKAPKASKPRRKKEKVVSEDAASDVAPAPSRGRSARQQSLATKLNEDAAKNIANLPSPTARKGQRSKEQLTLKDTEYLVIDDFEGILNHPFNEIPYNGVEMLGQHLDGWCDANDKELDASFRTDVTDLLKDLRETGTSIWSLLALYEVSEQHGPAIGKAIRSCYNNMEAGGGKSVQLLKAEFLAYLETHKNACPRYAALIAQFAQPGSPKE